MPSRRNMAPAYDGPQAPAAAQHSATGWTNNEAGEVQPTLYTAYDEDNQYDDFGEDQFNEQEFDLLCQATQPEAFPAPAIQTFEDEFANPVLSTAEGNDVAEPDLSTAEAAEEKARHAAELKRLEEERAELDRKYQELVNERFAKDGEIKTTRKRLEETESEKEDLERKLAIQSSQAAKEKAEIEEEYAGNEVFVVAAEEEAPVHVPAKPSVDVATEMSQPPREEHPVPVLRAGPQQASDAVLVGRKS
ncbi:hypothetical protein HDU88_008696 [Geranomyces variabilis]|nr:hypothetical protein HDU88_008696 [Geranomyces variabilis]